MNPVSPHAAASQARCLGICLALECRVPEVPDDGIRSLLQLVARHGVVCIDRQPLAPRELRDFAARWGELIELPSALAHQHQEPGLPSITRVGNVRPDGSIIPGVRFAEHWHHDGDFWAPVAIGDLVIVDNLQVMHRSLGGYGDRPRLLYRCQARMTAA